MNRSTCIRGTRNTKNQHHNGDLSLILSTGTYLESTSVTCILCFLGIGTLAVWSMISPLISTIPSFLTTFPLVYYINKENHAPHLNTDSKVLYTVKKSVIISLHHKNLERIVELQSSAHVCYALETKSSLTPNSRKINSVGWQEWLHSEEICNYQSAPEYFERTVLQSSAYVWNKISLTSNSRKMNSVMWQESCLSWKIQSTHYKHSWHKNLGGATLRSAAIGRCVYLNEITRAETNERKASFVLVMSHLHNKVTDSLSALIMLPFSLFLHESTDSA